MNTVYVLAAALAFTPTVSAQMQTRELDPAPPAVVEADPKNPYRGKETPDDPYKGRCPELAELIEAALPKEVGTAGFLPRLLEVKAETVPFSKSFDVSKARGVLGDELATNPTQCPPAKGQADHGPLELCAEVGSKLRLDRDRGRLTYLNPTRSFIMGKSKPVKLDEDAAVQKAKEVLQALGVPSSQLGEQATVRTLVAAGYSEGSKKGTRMPAEVHVRLGRQIDKVPVFDSEAKVAFDGNVDVARLRVRWPDFSIFPKISGRHALARSTVVEETVRSLSPTRGCNEYSKIRAFVSYAPTSTVGMPSQADDEDLGHAKTTYVPSVVVYAVPPEPKEDSGEVARPGIQVTVPLVSFQSDAYKAEKAESGG